MCFISIVVYLGPCRNDESNALNTTKLLAK